MLSGGSPASASVMPAAKTVTLHDSPCVKSTFGFSVNVALGLALRVNVCGPETVQPRPKLAVVALTGSLKLMVMSIAAPRFRRPFGGEVEVTVGAASTVKERT